MRMYEDIPIAAITAGVTSATGSRNREAFFVVETELLDSMTGERMFIKVYNEEGEEIDQE